MNGLIDWAASRARMVMAFIVLSVVAGATAYVSLPKEGEPDIEIPALFVSVPFQGISAADSETLLVKPMETELADIDGLKTMTSTASEGYAGVSLEFEFGWDKTQTMADVRDAMNNVQGQFPEGADQYTINEINFSEFPILIVNLTGRVPERTLLRVAKDLQDRLEGLEPVLSASLTGQRDEMLEVIIDPLRLEAYNVTATELIDVVTQNNQLIAAGEIETEQGAFAIKIPSSFDEAQDIYELVVKSDGDRQVTLGELAEIRLTFEDRTSTARFDGVNTVALQVVKRKGFNVIDTSALVQQEVAAERAAWPEELRDAIDVGTSNDQSRTIASMVSQLEGSVLTAVALVMIVVLAALGTRPALLMGFAIPTSFLLCFAFLAVMDVTISNIVMFGLILAVGMLVDGAIVVVEYADKRIEEGVGPMHAYTDAAKRMFWPVVSSTATTLCAFLPMLFWPGLPGQFMGMLPVTLIFVLCASLIVALIFLPIMGGITGRMSRSFGRAANGLRRSLPWAVRALLVPVAGALTFLGAMLILNPAYLAGGAVQTSGLADSLPGIALFLASVIGLSIALDSVKFQRKPRTVRAERGHTPFGWVIRLITGNPVMPLVTIAAVVGFVVFTFGYFGENSNGVEFFADSEPEQSIIYVQARGNLSLAEKDALVRQAEEVALDTVGIQTVFAFAGDGGLNSNTAGASGPADTIGQLQLELVPWEDRPAFVAANPDVTLEELDGDVVMERLQDRLDAIPGLRTEALNLAMGPGAAKPITLRLKGNDWTALTGAVAQTRAYFDQMPGLIAVEDTLPLPGIDWQIDVDVERAGQFGASVAAVGAMVQLVTRGILLDTMRVDSSDEEIEIRVRFPEDERVLSTLETLRVRTPDGLVPLSNFITLTPVEKLAQIDRIDQERYFEIRADVEPGFVALEAQPGDEIALPDEAGNVLAYAREIGDDVRVRDNGNPVLTGADGTRYQVSDLTAGVALADVERRLQADELRVTPITPTERIAELETWLADAGALPGDIGYEWAGDQADQAESQAFLMTAFIGALGLMFIILLAQFNSFYNAVLVLLAVIMSTAGVLIGMLVMDQAFSIIMTGTGIVALAGIVVNNNIVLIDTYQEYAAYMPRLKAIVRTAEERLRPVLLTTITTMAGLTPMMFGLSIDFFGGGYSVGSPTALWWTQLATAVVFGLGIATVLTLVFTPSMLALRVWVTTYARWLSRLLARLSFGRGSRAARDWALNREARQIRHPEIVWTEDSGDTPAPVYPADQPLLPLRAAE
ncbi:transporter, AcrB/AcrD/AcrF family protein [Oceanicola granulosus HTCC2516]|uniref:Transporter, AcrB/AcrD/AcrF family protein n=1 Tax=Oceanicola granulosus (strain ATCC BAA-861 / DSM 15982 / KCTC 12143 / HTCC2516) TaxID=314256 RepID=Q2CHQ0_OCEGH|nr:efflux RND transporter permease subunit [Oceanicola granulosus]EAR52244.1 transporter, AcrB/AcrD/AcrF family protein [Oceanicola granulosus HTCC2516]